MVSRNTSWWVALTMAGCLLAAWLGRAGPALGQEQAKATVVDLTFTEMKNGPSSWYGFMPGPDGNIERNLGPGTKKIAMQLKGTKLRIDTNGDGVVDDKDAPAVELKQDMQQPTRLTVPMMVGGKKVAYPFAFSLSRISDSQNYLLVSSAAMLEGKFGEYTIRIFDGNQDCQFGGPGDRIAIMPAGSPDANYGLPWSRTNTIAQQLYTFELLGEGAQLKLTPYTGPVAEVLVRFANAKPSDSIQITLQEESGAQIAECRPGATVKFVPGNYRLYNLFAQTGQQDNRPVYLNASSDSEKPAMVLKAGKNTLTFGPPLKMDFTAARDGSAMELTAVKITGVAGELYRPNVEDGKDTFAWYIKAAGKESELAKLSFG